VSVSRHWQRALSTRPADQLQALVRQLVAQGDWQLRPKALPQTGLGMLQLTDSALQDNYNLGEFPLVSAWLVISLPDGRSVEGAAQLMDDRRALAEALAVCDAVLRHRLPGWELVEDQLAAGLAALEQQDRERDTMLARTRVDFSLLDAVDDDDD
jgi:alpha-D-ribose 1-methylphosphonate 5-triphosphate synthase subunit PhnG